MDGQDGNNNLFAIFNAVPNFNDLTNICCIGSGPLAMLTTYVLAQRFPLKQFIIIDVDDTLLERYQTMAVSLMIGVIPLINMPFQEPEFNQMFINKHMGLHPNVNFRFQGNHVNVIRHAHVVIICYDLELLKPSQRIGAFTNVDISHWEKAVRLIRQHANHVNYRKLIIDFSPFPPIDTNKLSELLFGPGHILVSNPQFFSLGTAIQELNNPALVVLAMKSLHAVGFLDLVRGFYLNMGQEILLGFNFKAAEFSRLASSCCVGVMGIFSNLVETVSRELRINIENVMEVVTAAIGNEILEPNFAIGGPNMIRDLHILRFITHHFTLSDHTKFIRHAIAANEEKLLRQLRNMQNFMSSFKGKTISVFGFAFKEGTSDTSYSPSIFICRQLYKSGCHLRIYDPLVPFGEIRRVFPHANRVTIMGKNLQEMHLTCGGSDALCFFTRSEEFQQIDWDVARQLMVADTQVFVFDFARNGFNNANIEMANLIVGFDVFQN